MNAIFGTFADSGEIFLILFVNVELPARETSTLDFNFTITVNWKFINPMISVQRMLLPGR